MKIKVYKVRVRPRRRLNRWSRRLLGSRKAKVILMNGCSKKSVRARLNPYPYTITSIKRVRRKTW